MKILIRHLKRMVMVIFLTLPIGLGTSCMTTYDAQGRPVQSVDPSVAVVGAAAAFIVGASIADNDRGHSHYRHHRRPYYRCR